MTQISGASTVIGVKSTGTFATAVQAGAGDQLQVEDIDGNLNPTTLSANPIGSGLDMQNESELGSTAPDVKLNKIIEYDSAGNRLIAQFFGADSINAYAGGFTGHSFTYNQTRNQIFNTIAFKGTSGDVFEYPSCVTQKLTISMSAFSDYAKLAVDCLANDQVITGSVNTIASLNATTMANTLRVVAKPSDQFMVNAQAGAALNTSTDVKNCTKLELMYDIPVEFPKEMKNASGNGLPILKGSPPFKASLTATFRNLSDFTWFTAQYAGTEYKGSVTITNGSYSYVFLFPRLKVIKDPTYKVASANENPLVVTFDALVAPSWPAGMPCVYPQIITVNTRATSYLV